MWLTKISKTCVWCISLTIHFTYGIIEYDLQPLGNLNKIDVRLQKGVLFGLGQVRGSFEKVNGEIQFSMKTPASSIGSVLLDARTLRFGYHKVDGDAHQPVWLNSFKHPKIEFKLKGLRKEHWRGNTLNGEAYGSLSLKNKTSQITFPMSIKYLRNARRKFDGKRGDLIVLKGQLQLSRGAFGINPGRMLDVIKDELIVNISLIGCSNSSRPLLPSRLFI